MEDCSEKDVYGQSQEGRYKHTVTFKTPQLSKGEEEFMAKLMSLTDKDLKIGILWLDSTDIKWYHFSGPDMIEHDQPPTI